MDTMDTIKRLPKAVRERIETLRAEYALLAEHRDESKGAYWRFIEHSDKIDGYTTALYDAGIITKEGFVIVQMHCTNKEAGMIAVAKGGRL